MIWDVAQSDSGLAQRLSDAARRPTSLETAPRDFLAFNLPTFGPGRFGNECLISGRWSAGWFTDYPTELSGNSSAALLAALPTTPDFDRCSG